jgi:hypothetical protein
MNLHSTDVTTTFTIRLNGLVFVEGNVSSDGFSATVMAGPGISNEVNGTRHQMFAFFKGALELPLLESPPVPHVKTLFWCVNNTESHEATIRFDPIGLRSVNTDQAGSTAEQPIDERDVWHAVCALIMSTKRSSL